MPTYYGPSVRAISVDGSDGSAYDLGSYGILNSVKLVEKDQETTERTGPTDTATTNRPEGFTNFSAFEVDLDWNRGAPIDTTTLFNPSGVGSTTTRTVTVTFVTGDTEEYEAYYTGWEPTTEPKKKTRCKLTFTPDGNAPTYAP